MAKYQLAVTVDVFATTPTEGLARATGRLGVAVDTLKRTEECLGTVSGVMGGPGPFPEETTLAEFWQARYAFNPTTEEEQSASSKSLRAVLTDRVVLLETALLAVSKEIAFECPMHQATGFEFGCDACMSKNVGNPMLAALCAALAPR